MRGLSLINTRRVSKGLKRKSPSQGRGLIEGKGYDEVRHHTGCVVTVKFPDLLTTHQRERNPPLPLFLYLRLKNNSANSSTWHEARSANRFPVSLFILLDLLDDVGCRATIFKVEHQHFTAVGPDFFTPGDLFRFIVAAFHQQIRQDPGDQALRRIFFNDTTQSTASSAPSTIMRCSSGLTGRESPFSRLVEASLFTATIKRSPSLRAFAR